MNDETGSAVHVCDSCQAELPTGARFCPSCAAPTEAGPPLDALPPTQRIDSTSEMGISFDNPGWFGTGDLIVDRYRIIEKLGVGGVGEVYRAEDLILRQSVALKFLKGSVDAGGDGSEFVREVNVARRVAHPNTCRVFDIGEVGGRRFLSMEYVDGEDLASLLRRIGRLPTGKAEQVAVQLAAGLAAVHAQGVLHRDLKPANVMIDGAGNARITDFGLAAFSTELDADVTVSGTPAYMAPELFTGGKASIQSDLYSLGALLFELFTGRMLFRAQSMTELLEQHRQPLPNPAEAVDGLSPSVERTVLQCLAHDPRLRPRSALQVAACLPGGDPLASVMAAGETPSAELIAAAGSRGVMRPGFVTAALVALVLLLAATLALARSATLVGHVPLPLSVEVLAAYADDHLEAIGFDVRSSTHVACGFAIDEDVLRFLDAKDGAVDQWGVLADERIGAIEFWYRRSAEPLLPARSSWPPAWDRPPGGQTGSVRLRLDSAGRLRELWAVPAGTDRVLDVAADNPAPIDAPDVRWNPLFEAADLEMAAFIDIAPRFAWNVPTDARRAWVRKAANATDAETLVEAASFEGSIVGFHVANPAVASKVGNATMPNLKSRTDPDVRGPWAALFELAIVLGAVMLAWNNVRHGRVDRRGAWRVTIGLTGLALLGVLLRAGHVASSRAEVEILLDALAASCLVGFQFWVFYAAVEPHVRRRWPETMIAWTRLLHGDVQDPFVGRNVLFGMLLGVGAFALVLLDHRALELQGWPPAMPLFSVDWGMAALLGTRHQIGVVCGAIVRAHFVALSFVLGVVLMRILLRDRRWAIVAFALLQTAVWGGRSMQTPLSWAICETVAILCSVVLLRLGVLALLSAAVAFLLLATLPLTTDPSDWYAGATVIGLGLVLGCGTVGAWFAGLSRSRFTSTG